MADEITRLDDHFMVIDEDPSRAAGIANARSESGINRLAFPEFPHGPAKSRLDLIAGENRPAAIARIPTQLADASIGVTALQAISAGTGRFGALLRVKPPDVENAALVLGASAYQSAAYDVVDSGAPSRAMTRIA